MNTDAKLQKQNFTTVQSELDPDKVLFCFDHNNQLRREEWKDIPKFEGYYQCSTFGRVKSLLRKVKRGKHFLSVGEKIIKQHIPQKYYVVRLSKNSKETKTLQTHQLVAITFLEHTPNGFINVIDHKDNIRTNNFVWNLQKTTNRHNASKDKTGGTSKYVGVSWHTKRKRWRASIYVNGKEKHLGFFTNELNAHKYYQKALKSIKNGTEIEVKRRTNTSQHRGVYKKGNKWAVEVKTSKGKQKYIGTFGTEEEAVIARDVAEKEIRTGKQVTIHEAQVSSKHKYISFNSKRKRWIIAKGGKYIGSYLTEEEAVKAKKEYLSALPKNPLQ